MGHNLLFMVDVPASANDGWLTRVGRETNIVLLPGTEAPPVEQNQEHASAPHSTPLLEAKVQWYSWFP